jgi:hypothetical protein
MDLMYELGVGEDCEDVPVPPMDDERWHTDLGQVILQSTIEWNKPF